MTRKKSAPGPSGTIEPTSDSLVGANAHTGFTLAILERSDEGSGGSFQEIARICSSQPKLGLLAGHFLLDKVSGLIGLDQTIRVTIQAAEGGRS